MANGPFVKVYQSIVDDPMFERVFRNDHALATWLRMLLVADAMYPTSAPMPPRNPTVRLLIDCSLVIEEPFNRYSVRGLMAEREHRSASGKHAAAMRWQSGRNAKQSRAEQSRADSAHASTNGSRGNGWSQGYEALPGEAVVPRHEGQHPDCLVCEPMRREATA